MKATYKELILAAERSGVQSKDIMHKSVEHIDELLGKLQHTHPDLYHRFMLDEYILLHGKHLNEDWAKEIVAAMHHTDENSVEVCGEHYTMEQAKQLLMPHVPACRACEMYVALNATWHDWSCLYKQWNICSDTHLAKSAATFWFKDEDYPTPEEKIWKYFCE